MGCFVSAEQEFSIGRDAVSSARSPACSAAIKERVAALITLWHVHDQATAYLGNHLPGRVYTCRPRTSASYATAASQKGLVIGECSELNRGLYRVGTGAFGRSLKSRAFTVLAVWAFQRLMGVIARLWKEQPSAARSSDVSAVSEANGTTVPVSLDLGSSLSIQPSEGSRSRVRRTR